MALRDAIKHYEITSREDLAIALCEAQRFLETDDPVRVRSLLTVTKFDPSSQRQRDYFHLIMKKLAVSVLWHGTQLRASEWEELLIAAWRKEFLVPGLLGGFAFVGGNGNVERLSRDNCSEVLYLAEEFMSRIGLSVSSHVKQRLNVVQLGSDLSDLVVAPVARPSKSIKRYAPTTRRVPWSNVTWRGNAWLPDELLCSGEETEHEA